MPRDRGERRAALALLHDGRLLRLPRHHRWRRQSPGLPGACRRGHADRNSEGQKGDRPMNAPKRDSYELVVIGAGPAGLAAAATAAEAGLATLLLDENAGPGGQVWRAIASTPVTERDRLGADYWAGADLVQAARSSGAEIVQRATVWSLDRHLELGVSVGGAS